MPNNIEESKDLLSRNYWNKTKYICDYTIKKHKRKMCYLQKNDLWLLRLKSAKLFYILPKKKPKNIDIKTSKMTKKIKNQNSQNLQIIEKT